MNLNIYWIIAAIGLSLLTLLFLLYFWNKGRTQLKNARLEVEKILTDARKRAGEKKRESELEAKEKWVHAKLQFEQDTEKRRREIQEEEEKFRQKELNLNRKNEYITEKGEELEEAERSLTAKERAMKTKEEHYTRLIEEENQKLERISGLTQDQAKQKLMSNLESEARLESLQMIKNIRDKAKETADREAKRIIITAIQRCAADHSAEATISIVSLPGEEMKGRIIGKEGRNIRSFETLTGTDVIIDETPDAVTLSSFDPFRREIARIALEKLIADGRIHPARIEEIVKKTEVEMEQYILETGEETVVDVGIPGIHSELLKLLGRLKYRTSFGQNVLMHSKEVALLAGLMAGELGLDIRMAKRAGLLHDIGKAVDHAMEGGHADIGAQLAERYGEPPIVINAIAAHHEDVDPISPIVPLIDASDAISGARPGARRETFEAYIQRLSQLEEIADSFKGVKNSYAIQAGREVRVIVEPDSLTDTQASDIAVQVAKRIQDELKYPGQIKVTVIREQRTVEYAK
ncbi:ribonuclease Y [candidate division TA06 bacterium]|nr:ribonuclease Y [candidate division TA06 bacterium]